MGNSSSKEPTTKTEREGDYICTYTWESSPDGECWSDGVVGDVTGAYAGYYTTSYSSGWVCNSRTLARDIKLYQQGEELWCEAWKLEDKGETYQAQCKFNQAKEKFDESNSMYQTEKAKNFSLIASLKIQGNASFNEGDRLLKQAIDHLKEAYRLKELKRFHDAEQCLKKAKKEFQDAKDKFRQAYHLSNNDHRFKVCENIVDDNLTEIEKLMVTISNDFMNSLTNSQSNGQKESNFERITTRTSRIFVL